MRKILAFILFCVAFHCNAALIETKLDKDSYEEGDIVIIEVSSIDWEKFNTFFIEFIFDDGLFELVPDSEELLLEDEFGTLIVDGISEEGFLSAIYIGDDFLSFEGSLPLFRVQLIAMEGVDKYALQTTVTENYFATVSEPPLLLTLLLALMAAFRRKH